MTISRRSLMSLSGAALLFAASGQDALAKSVVVVSLWDKGEASMEGADGMAPMGMAMEGADMAMATMGITLTKSEIPAGEVSFRITNDSLDFYHNLTISPVVGPEAALPYKTEEKMVDEAAAGLTARSAELPPHTSKTLDVTLQPGTYILYCNVSGHYAMGMWVLLTVTG